MRDGKEKVWRFTPMLPDGYTPANPNTVVEPPGEDPVVPAEEPTK